MKALQLLAQLVTQVAKLAQQEIFAQHALIPKCLNQKICVFAIMAIMLTRSKLVQHAILDAKLAHQVIFVCHVGMII